jgi:hypothetical protein
LLNQSKLFDAVDGAGSAVAWKTLKMQRDELLGGRYGHAVFQPRSLRIAAMKGAEAEQNGTFKA